MSACAALNLLFGVINVFQNGGYLGPLAADAYNLHIPLLARASARVDAVIVAGLITPVGCGFALARLSRLTRGRAIVGVMANLASMSVVLAAFAFGIDLGE